MNKSRPIFMIVILIALLAVLGFISYRFLTHGGTGSDRAQTPDDELEYTNGVKRNIPSDAGNYPFDDGLKNPNVTSEFELDETGTGVAKREIFNIDINGDNRPDRITRERVENGTDHFYDEYKIELNTGDNFIDITPAGFRTTEGADCSLQKIRFIFTPQFNVIKISRPWDESWITPTIATRTIYKLKDNKLEPGTAKQLREICNVSDLF